MSEDTTEGISVFKLLPSDTLIWLDSSDMYKEKEFFPLTEQFKRVFIDTPLGDGQFEEKIPQSQGRRHGIAFSKKEHGAEDEQREKKSDEGAQGQHAGQCNI